MQEECTKEVKPDCLGELLSCRLIPLKKDDPKDVRLYIYIIGIGEVLRRIMGKDVMRVIRQDIMETCGSLQTCSGLESGIEAAVHAMATQFKDEKTQALPSRHGMQMTAALVVVSISFSIGG